MISPFERQGREPALQPPERATKEHCEHGVEWEMPCGECAAIEIEEDGDE